MPSSSVRYIRLRPSTSYYTTNSRVGGCTLSCSTPTRTPTCIHTSSPARQLRTCSLGAANRQHTRRPRQHTISPGAVITQTHHLTSGYLLCSHHFKQLPTHPSANYMLFAWTLAARPTSTLSHKPRRQLATQGFAMPPRSPKHSRPPPALSPLPVCLRPNLPNRFPNRAAPYSLPVPP